jgi:hypothetical protein
VSIATPPRLRPAPALLPKPPAADLGFSVSINQFTSDTRRRWHRALPVRLLRRFEFGFGFETVNFEIRPGGVIGYLVTLVLGATREQIRTDAPAPFIQ